MNSLYTKYQTLTWERAFSRRSESMCQCRVERQCRRSWWSPRGLRPEPRQLQPRAPRRSKTESSHDQAPHPNGFAARITYSGGQRLFAVQGEYGYAKRHARATQGSGIKRAHCPNTPTGAAATNADQAEVARPVTGRRILTSANRRTSSVPVNFRRELTQDFH